MEVKRAALLLVLVLVLVASADARRRGIGRAVHNLFQHKSPAVAPAAATATATATAAAAPNTNQQVIIQGLNDKQLQDATKIIREAQEKQQELARTIEANKAQIAQQSQQISAQQKAINDQQSIAQQKLDTESAKLKALAKAKVSAARKYNKPSVDGAVDLRSVAGKLKGLSLTAPIPSTLTKEEQLNLKAQRIQAPFVAMAQLSLRLQRLIPLLENEPDKKMRDGRNPYDHLRDIYVKLEALKPQFKDLKTKFPGDKSSIDVLKKMENQILAVLKEQTKRAEAQKRQGIFDAAAKAVAKPDNKAAFMVPGAQCTTGGCCDPILYRFRPKGYGCRASECVESNVCLGGSGECPAGKALPDGTACKGGSCSSGVCILDSVKKALSCSEGGCCDPKTHMFKAMGSPCDVSKHPCLEAASLCSGTSNECTRKPKPEGTYCSGGLCHAGVCKTSKIKKAEEIKKADVQIKAEKKEIKKLDSFLKTETPKIDLANNILKAQGEELKAKIRKFGITAWMLLQMKKKAMDKSGEIAVDETYNKYDMYNPNHPLNVALEKNAENKNAQGGLVSDLASGASNSIISGTTGAANATATATTSLLSSGTSSAESGLSATAIILIVAGSVALLIIVIFFIMNRPKKTQPKVIY